MDRRLVGSNAERAARRHLEASGLELICENYRCRVGELDLVMREGQTLVVVEVRLRAPSRFADGAGSIDVRKQRRIARATQHLLSRNRSLATLPVRFDVVALQPPPANSLQWIRGAFEVAG